MEVGAVRGVLASVLGLITGGATHVAVATDHVIESFRNRLWPATRPAPASSRTCSRSFSCSRTRCSALGVTVWPMVEWEADDALAAAAMQAAADPAVERVVICTPDKDLAQCVRGDARRAAEPADERDHPDEAGVVKKFGVPPASIPDYLALVGDAADGYPGLPGLGSQIGRSSAGAVRQAGGHPGGLARVACQCQEPRGPGVDARA